MPLQQSWLDHLLAVEATFETRTTEELVRHLSMRRRGVVPRGTVAGLRQVALPFTSDRN